MAGPTPKPSARPPTAHRPLGIGVTAAFLVGVLALVAIAIVSLLSIRSLIETAEWVAHTQEVLATLAAEIGRAHV